MKYEDIDFNELYVTQKQKTSFRSKNSDAWDKKAVNMNKKVHKSIYNEQFLELLDLKEIDSVLDVGCGVGNLSLKLAKQIDKVNSLDFSPKMLEMLKENAKEQNITNINTINKSWYDSWDEVPKSDLVIASRSMEVKNMKQALLKLNSKANKKVVVSYKKGGSFVSKEILDILQREIISKPDYIYLVNILYSMGISASVNFIQSEGRGTSYESKEKFIETISWSIDNITDIEIKRLEEYYDTLDVNSKKSDDYVYWAIISWDK